MPALLVNASCLCPDWTFGVLFKFESVCYRASVFAVRSVGIETWIETQDFYVCTGVWIEDENIKIDSNVHKQ